jgi:hypothetical protein
MRDEMRIKCGKRLIYAVRNIDQPHTIHFFDIFHSTLLGFLIRDGI